LVAIPEREDSLRKAVGEAHRLYTRGINFRTRKRGYFFQGRRFSCPLDDEHYFAALRYVECNPVRAGLVAEPWDFFWSGARFHAGFVPTDPLIDVDALSHWRLTPDQWRKILQTEVAEINILRKKTRTGRPCGNDAFIDRLEEITGRRLRPRKPDPHKKG
jgi:putative transposase